MFHINETIDRDKTDFSKKILWYQYWFPCILHKTSYIRLVLLCLCILVFSHRFSRHRHPPLIAIKIRPSSNSHDLKVIKTNLELILRLTWIDWCIWAKVLIKITFFIGLAPTVVFFFLTLSVSNTSRFFVTVRYLCKPKTDIDMTKSEVLLTFFIQGL